MHYPEISDLDAEKVREFIDEAHFDPDDGADDPRCLSAVGAYGRFNVGPDCERACDELVTALIGVANPGSAYFRDVDEVFEASIADEPVLTHKIRQDRVRASALLGAHVFAAAARSEDLQSLLATSDERPHGGGFHIRGYDDGANRIARQVLADHPTESLDLHLNTLFGILPRGGGLMLWDAYEAVRGAKRDSLFPFDERTPDEEGGGNRVRRSRARAALAVFQGVVAGLKHGTDLLEELEEAAIDAPLEGRLLCSSLCGDTMARSVTKQAFDDAKSPSRTLFRDPEPSHLQVQPGM